MVEIQGPETLPVSWRGKGVHGNKPLMSKRTYLISLPLADWDCVAAVERLPALHYSEDFIFLSFGIMGYIDELLNY